ncbi:hypothetical protein NM688_g5067 [Phlebia brevispora]|uniref:Uncharacterized protein n=1 Tax=Phlebia brevispora TaxID=194682 RepID=A0ACC1T1E2_9APHY|nr:hypothetical protein NM688_g5067 [Phlebia brevispora]
MNSTNVTVPDAALMLAEINIGATVGVGYLGVAFASMLYGITCVQTYNYYQSSKSRSDQPTLKWLVAVLLLLDTLHQVFVVWSLYHYLIENFANPTAIITEVWTVNAGIIVNVKFCFLRSGNLYGGPCLEVSVMPSVSHNPWITGFCVPTVGGSSVCDEPQIQIYSQEVVTELIARLKTLGITALCTMAAADMSIAATMIFYLRRNRTGFRRSDNIISKLIILTVTTGTVTTCFTIADAIAYIAAPTTFYILFFTFTLSKLYINSLLTTLNTRDVIRNFGRYGGNTDINTIPLTNLGIERGNASPLDVVVSETKIVAISDGKNMSEASVPSFHA